jgi:hypothetical protein
MYCKKRYKHRYLEELMNEKLPWRIVAGLSVVILLLGGWLFWIYRDRGDTQDHLAEAQSQLSASYRGNEYLAEELRRSASTVLELEDQQRESDAYQQRLEGELELGAEYLRRLEDAVGLGDSSLGRFDDLLGVGAGLLADGNEYIEDREE